MRNQKELIYISVDKLVPHPNNPRKDLGDLTELADSIKANGVMQNLTVVPGEDGKYTVVIGHRRCAASMIAGLTELPCVIENMTPREQMATMLLENMQRSDLTVYEQAKGMQLMIDLGESVESLSSMTGFSQSTIRRRLKMAELDDAKLKEAVSSGRQLSLGDFDKMAQIEDVEERNNLLEHIGTHNFDNKLETALRLQKKNKAMPFIMQELNTLGAKEITSSDRYSSKYEQVTSFDMLTFDSSSKIKIPKKHTKEKNFYYFFSYNHQCEIWIKAKRQNTKVAKRPQAEIDREKYIEETRAKLAELTERAYTLRYNFIKTVKMTKENISRIFDGAILALMCEQGPDYIDRRSPEYYCENLNIPKEKFNVYGDRLNVIREGYQNCVDSHVRTPDPGIIIIYASFGDSKDKRCYGGYIKAFPYYQQNRTLELLYKFLTSLGYEMSDEEKQLLDGTHPLFVDKDKPAEK